MTSWGRSRRAAAVQERVRSLSGPTVLPTSLGRAVTRWCGVAGLTESPERWFLTTLAGALMAAVVGATRSPWVAGFLGVMVVGARFALLLLRVRNAPNRIEGAVPPFLDAVAAELRSGASITGALLAPDVRVGALAPDVAVLQTDLRHGATLADALVRWCRRSGGDSVRAAAAALRIAHERGGNLAPVLEHLAATLRERLAALADVRVQSLQVRLSALVVAALPLLYLAFSLSIDPASAALLVATGPGRWCLALGLGADALAWWWIARIVGAPL